MLSKCQWAKLYTMPSQLTTVRSITGAARFGDEVALVEKEHRVGREGVHGGSGGKVRGAEEHILVKACFTHSTKLPLNLDAPQSLAF